MSVLLSAVAPTRTRTWPAAGVGSGTSSRYSSWSGPPKPVSSTARMMCPFDVYRPVWLLQCTTAGRTCQRRYGGTKTEPGCVVDSGDTASTTSTEEKQHDQWNQRHRPDHAHRGHRDGRPGWRVLLGHGGPHPPPARRAADPGRLHRWSERPCDVPQPSRPRRGGGDRLRSHEDDLPRHPGVLLPDPRPPDAAPAGPRPRAQLPLGHLPADTD